MYLDGKHKKDAEAAGWDPFGVLRALQGPSHPSFLPTVCQFHKVHWSLGSLGERQRALQYPFRGYGEWEDTTSTCTFCNWSLLANSWHYQ